MNNTSVFDENLNPVLCAADNDDLNPLVEYLETKLSSHLSVEDAYKEHAPNHTKYPDLIAKEIRDMGGNSFANIFRGMEGPSYYEIVCDVADKLKVPYNKKRDISDIEDAILQQVLNQVLDAMSEEDKAELLESLGQKAGSSLGGTSTAVFIAIFKAGGFKSYQLTLMIANYIARLILGKGLTIPVNAAIAKYLGVLTGPVGIAITGLWTVVDVASPAYKVTIPCVIHIAMLRKKYNSLNCTNCDAVSPDTSAKFCSECGEKLSA